MIYNFSHSHHSRARDTSYYFTFKTATWAPFGKGFYNFPIYFYSSCAYSSIYNNRLIYTYDIYHNMHTRHINSMTPTHKLLNNNIELYTGNFPIKKASSYNLFLFSNVLNILGNNPMNHNTQLMIERYLNEQFKDYISNKAKPFILGVDTEKFSGGFNKYCFDKIDEIKVYIYKYKYSFMDNNISNNNVNSVSAFTSKAQINDYFFKQIINSTDIDDFVNIMLYTFFRIATYNDINIKADDMAEDDIKTSLLQNGLKIGKHMSNIYTKIFYKQYLKENNYISLSMFKQDFISKDINNNLFEDSFYLYIGGKLIEIMTTCNMLEVKVIKNKNNSIAVLQVSDEVSLLNVKNKALSIPLNLPMIVKPKPYSENKLGGYLLNDVEYDEGIFTKKIGYAIPSTIQENSIVYFVVNKMMETSFKVNKELLNYLLRYNHIHKLLIDPDFEHKLLNVKRNKAQEKEYQQFLSKKLLEEYIIKIAQTYSNVPEIFFPIKLDNRGRLYPKTAFFHYQGSELAKALILFARPDLIKRSDKEAIEYLKAYGATCFGNGLNRKSYTKRLDWVDNN